MQKAANVATNVRIAVWNIQAVGTPGSDEYNDALAVLGRIGADVVGINEVFNSSDMPNFQSLASDAGYSFTIVPSSNPFGNQRNAFMSKYPYFEQTIYTAADLSGDSNANDITRNMVSVKVDLPDNDRHLVLIVEHWKAGFGDDDEFRRAIESFRMAQTVAALDAQSDVFVFMGDMNEEIESVPRTPTRSHRCPLACRVRFVWARTWSPK